MLAQRQQAKTDEICCAAETVAALIKVVSNTDAAVCNELKLQISDSNRRAMQ